MRLAMVGDIFLNRSEPSTALSGVRSILRSCDGIVGNLEGALTQGAIQRSLPKDDRFGSFRAAPDQLSAFTGLPPLCLVLANNHSADFGSEPLIETLDHLWMAGIVSSGAGRTWEDATKAAILRCNQGAAVAVLAFTCVFQPGWRATKDAPGLAALRVTTSYDLPRRSAEQPGTPPVVNTRLEASSVDELVGAINRARSAVGKDAAIIVTVHWGISGNFEPLDYQHEIGRICAEAGVSVVFGTGPHICGPVDFVGRMPLLYSLGSLVFDQAMPDYGGLRAAIAIMTVSDDGQCESVDLVPLHGDAARTARPRPLTAAEAQRYGEMLDLGPPLPDGLCMWRLAPRQD